MMIHLGRVPAVIVLSADGAREIMKNQDDIFADGTDTTYTALEWAMAQLLKHPKTMEKLQNEVRQTARSKLEKTEDDLEKILYLKAVTKEILRLHPPLPLLLPQECTQDSAILGYDIAVGTRVIINS
ncbi:Cytochrome [Abeliophyllum distichum]|uniref:Cytochrome n=1 Tax=Abeliophyllum distichum TaxID=126358 RepID=A0ABD1RWB9_9LAMI